MFCSKLKAHTNPCLGHSIFNIIILYTVTSTFKAVSNMVCIGSMARISCFDQNILRVSAGWLSSSLLITLPLTIMIMINSWWCSSWCIKTWFIKTWSIINEPKDASQYNFFIINPCHKPPHSNLSYPMTLDGIHLRNRFILQKPTIIQLLIDVTTFIPGEPNGNTQLTTLSCKIQRSSLNMRFALCVKTQDIFTKRVLG